MRIAYGYSVTLPRTDGFLYSCKEEEMVNTIQYNVWNAGGLEIEQGMLNPLLEIAKSSGGQLDIYRLDIH